MRVYRVILSFAIIFTTIMVMESRFANAKCERHAFEVNDYGKEGPIRMARENLYKFVEKLKKEKGLKKVRVKESEPKCRLFLDFIVFDEHTCRIEANICY